MEKRIVKTNVVNEITIPVATVQLWRPLRAGEPCSHDLSKPDPNHVCRECYGIGIKGAYRDPVQMEIQNATMVEVQDPEDQEATPDILESWTPLQFECSFEHHVYPGCILVLDGYGWAVVDIETTPDPEGALPLPHHLYCTCRRLQEYELAYLFLTEHKGFLGQDKLA